MVPRPPAADAPRHALRPARLRPPALQHERRAAAGRRTRTGTRRSQPAALRAADVGTVVEHREDLIDPTKSKQWFTTEARRKTPRVLTADFADSEKAVF